MGDSALVSVLLYGHIVSAIGLLGGSLLFAFAIGPTLPKLTPAARAEVVVKLLPRVTSVLLGFSGLLSVFGIALAYVMTGGDLSRFSSSTPWGLRISIGIVLGFAALLIAILLIRPSVNELARLQSSAPTDQPPPPRLRTVLRRVQVGALVSELVMLVTVGFMVAAAGV